MRCTDFYSRYNLVLANWFVFSERTRRELQTVRDDLHDELARWQPAKGKLNWNAYAERMNAICRTHGYPALFAGASEFSKIRSSRFLASARSVSPARRSGECRLQYEYGC
jgi:hypothetical protein